MRRFRLFFTVNVKVAMLVPVVIVGMRVDLLCGEDFPDRIQTEQHEHYSDHSFENSLGAFRYLKLNEDHQCSDYEQRDRMPEAPESADDRCGQNVFVFTHDRRDGRQMIGLDRVIQAENEADQQHGNRRLFGCRD